MHSGRVLYIEHTVRARVLSPLTLLSRCIPPTPTHKRRVTHVNLRLKLRNRFCPGVGVYFSSTSAARSQTTAPIGPVWPPDRGPARPPPGRGLTPPPPLPPRVLADGRVVRPSRLVEDAAAAVGRRHARGHRDAERPAGARRPGLPQYAVRAERPRLVRVPGTYCTWGPGGKPPCASGTYPTREAGTRSPYVPYGGPGRTCQLS